MDIVVQKFGGSSVADKDKLFQVCRHIIKEAEKENKIVVVVSAQRKNNRQSNLPSKRINRQAK